MKFKQNNTFKNRIKPNRIHVNGAKIKVMAIKSRGNFFSKCSAPVFYDNVWWWSASQSFPTRAELRGKAVRCYACVIGHRSILRRGAIPVKRMTSARRFNALFLMCHGCSVTAANLGLIASQMDVSSDAHPPLPPALGPLFFFFTSFLFCFNIILIG